jgi:hypothetical protein
MIHSREKFTQFLIESADQKYLNLEAFSKNKDSIFKIKGSNWYVVDIIKEKERVTTSKEIERLYIAANASGMINTKLSFTSGGITRETDESMTILDIAQFISWFNRISSNIIFVPDTNTLLNRSFSGLGFILGEGYLRNLSVQIPRLTVLEMERIGNQEGHNEQKRKVMAAAAEVLYLKQNGGTFMPELNDQILQTFSHLSGERFTDTWIRREIHQQINRITYGSNPQETKRVTLLTSDLINAITATAEGINVLYLTRDESELILPRSHKIDQISQFIIMCSILFEELTVKISGKEFTIQGIWQGKTPSEWIMDSIKITQ